MHKSFDGQTTQLLIKDLFCYPNKEIVSARVVCLVALVVVRPSSALLRCGLD